MYISTRSVISVMTQVAFIFILQTEEVIQKIKEAGFKIQFEKEVTLTKELASQFYQEHQGKDFYEHLTDYMSRCVLHRLATKIRSV